MILSVNVSTESTSADDTSPTMHAPDHADILPEHVDPIPMPDTEEEAWLLRVLLELGFYPKWKALLGRKEYPETEAGEREPDPPGCDGRG